VMAREADKIRRSKLKGEQADAGEL
jgi:hypothetical protein